MFKGLLNPLAGGPLSRQERRLAVVASSTRHVKSQRNTYNHAERHLSRLAERRHRLSHRANRAPVRGAGVALSDNLSFTTQAQEEALASEAAWRTGLRGATASHGNGRYRVEDARLWRVAAAAQREAAEMHDVVEDVDGVGSVSENSGGGGSSRRAALHYDTVDVETGESVIQTRFNALVHEALLHYGPPLPAEFVAANDVVTSASGSPTYAPQSSSPFNNASFSHRESYLPGRDAHSTVERVAWNDLGADGRTFFLYDEVALKPHELLTAIRKVEPTFSLKDDCDGVPLSLLIKNCPFLRAFGGRVQYMRYLRRETYRRSAASDAKGGGRESSEEDREDAPGTVVLSIAKYKYREPPPQDGIRQGPQPWRHSYQLR